MPPRLPRVHTLGRPHQCLLRRPTSHRYLTVLAIESSCDDTSVAVLDTPSPTSAKLLFHETITSANKPTGGIHPFVSVVSHRRTIAGLLERALRALPANTTPDLIAVTRGPGMASNLGIGLDLAKGLAVAFRKPFVGVHHMLAHALTPRLTYALLSPAKRKYQETGMVQYPFLTVLASGGHTMLVESRGLVDHTVVSDTMDIAVGDMLDKAARMILPKEFLETQPDTISYGALLESFSLPHGKSDYKYYVPGTGRRREENQRKIQQYGEWNLPVPLQRTPRPDAFSFSGLGSAVERIHKARPRMSWEEKAELGREIQMIAFEHIADRVLVRLRKKPQDDNIKTLVVSGGVASNRFFRYMLQRFLEHHGLGSIDVVFPPGTYCTDNAAMIAWAGAEMFREGYQTSLDIMPIRKWSMDSEVSLAGENESEALSEPGVGGILGVRGWIKRGDRSESKIIKEDVEEVKEVEEAKEAEEVK